MLRERILNSSIPTLNAVNVGENIENSGVISFNDDRDHMLIDAALDNVCLAQA